jgi:hypothetical protein
VKRRDWVWMAEHGGLAICVAAIASMIAVAIWVLFF